MREKDLERGLRMREYTSKEMKRLKANPYTYKVTKHKLYFTASFKEAFWTGYRAGVAPRQLLAELGYDLKLFGQKQIDNIIQSVKKQALSGCGFSEGESRENRPRRVAEEKPESIEQVWSEVKYLRQEVEFLKKILKGDVCGGLEIG